MFGELGIPELLVILGIALLVFGPRRLGDLGKGLGEGIRGFKSALKGEPEPTPAAAKPAATVEGKQS
jgi:sec-independent protein translocase protein TatA